MAKRKPNPIKPASLSNPNPDYVFPIPEANKLLGPTYIREAQFIRQMQERYTKREKNKYVKGILKNLQEADDRERIGKEYLSGKRNAFNNRLTLKKDEHREIYDPAMQTLESGEGPKLTTTEYHVGQRNRGIVLHKQNDWSGNLISKQRHIWEGIDTWADETKIPTHLQKWQHKKWTSKNDPFMRAEDYENVLGASYDKKTKEVSALVANPDWHKNVEEAYKTGTLKPRNDDQLKLF